MFIRLSLLFIFFFLLVTGSVQADAGKRVVFIRYRIAPSHFTTVVNGFKESMARRGFKEGEQVEYVDILTRSADSSSVPDVMAAVAEWGGKADMVITSGWVSMYARPRLKETRTPQLFVPVLKSVALRMLPSVTAAPGTNLSGVYLMYPPEKILRLVHLLIPGLKNYAYVYDSRIPADMVFKSAYEQLKAEEYYGVTVHYLDLAAGLDQVLQDFRLKRIESYGGVVGSFKQRMELAVSGLPVITSFTLDIERDELEKYVRQGNIVAGLFNPFRYCGEQAAEMTADIFSGITTIERTIPRPAMQQIFINLETADRLQLPVSFKALESVDIVIR